VRTKPLPFLHPFERKHCAVIALTMMTRRPSAKFALSLAESAYYVPGVFNATILSRSGGARNFEMNIEKWCALSGLAVAEKFKPKIKVESIGAGHYVTRRDREVYYRRPPLRVVGRPTLAQFQRAHRRGRWIVVTNNHAIALVNGVYHDPAEYNARVRVVYAFRLIEKKLAWDTTTKMPKGGT
jgi:hypothetical protein